MTKYFIVSVFALLFFCSPSHSDTIIQSTNGDCSPAVSNVSGNVAITCTFSQDNETFTFSTYPVMMTASGSATKFVVEASENIEQLSVSMDGNDYYKLREAPFVVAIQDFGHALWVDINSSYILTGRKNRIFFKACNVNCDQEFDMIVELDIAKELSDTARTNLLAHPHISCLGRKLRFVSVVQVIGFEAVQSIGYKVKRNGDLIYWLITEDNIGNIIEGEYIDKPDSDAFLVPDGTKRIFVTANFIDGTSVKDLPVTLRKEGACENL